MQQAENAPGEDIFSVDHNHRQGLGPVGKAGGLIGFDTISLKYQHPDLLDLIAPCMKGDTWLPPPHLQIIRNFEFFAELQPHIFCILV